MTEERVRELQERLERERERERNMMLEWEKKELELVQEISKRERPSEKRLSEMRDQISGLEKTLEDTQEKLQTSLTRGIESAASISLLESHVSLLTKELAKRSEELGRTEASLSEVRKEVTMKSEEVERMETSLKESREKILLIETDLWQHKINMEVVRNGRESVQSALLETRERLETEVARSSRLEQQVAGREELEEQEKTRHRQEVDRLKEECAKMTAALAGTADRVRRAEECQSQAEDRLEVEVNRGDELEIHIRSIETELSLMFETLKKAEEQKLEAQTALDTTNRRAKKLELMLVAIKKGPVDASG
eukprot:CAMPEP_0182423310 /NCGR_PEP_ID=MMETSP1167-20130531/9265_1 /TAXON_ID=2988 /ORGANISM="Mallomonas Sp, Strain CCMP3275" /LENGTH=310 /DNA_ID=CAMNT_0024602157 /DNA_START=26 /DNA_END=958 /DNA_ORIENTATION=-